MSARGTFSAYLIGADTLLIECAEILLAGGHELRGVISRAPRIVEWARGKGLAVLDPKGDYQSALAAAPFDYLFAITHLAIIPDEVVAMPQKGAINFHDGPLPRYAGLNTPAWALINGEQSYGITFHFITREVDQGDILEQRLFDVTPQETSLSLNTKCFAAAIEAFQELVSHLAHGTASWRKQDLSERSYFPKHQRPPAACVLDFTQPAAKLEALVRALDFGHRYANPLGAAKVHKDGRVVLVRQAEARDDEAEGAPGRVLEANDKELVVATAEGALALTAFSTVFGRELDARAAAALLGVVAGDALDLLTAEQAQRLTETTGTLARSEEFWAQRLHHLEPLELPQVSAVTGKEPRYTPLPFVLPRAVLARFPERPQDQVLAAGALYLGRVGGKQHYHLAYSDQALSRELAGLEAWVSTEVPLEMHLDPAATAGAAVQRFTEELATVRKRKSFLLDVIARHPDLLSHGPLGDGRLLPVALALHPRPERYTPRAGTALALVVSEDGTEAALVYDGTLLGPDAVLAMKDQLLTLLEDLSEHKDRRLAELAILSAEERQRVLFDWNRTETAYRKDACVHQLIEEQAARTPDATAVVFEAESLSYRQLDERANQLAHHLRELGVGPDMLVGLYVERSLELLVAILGVMKAGGAYVPLDPAYPADRIAFMIEDSRASVLITEERLTADLPPSQAKLVRLDADRTAIERRPKGAPASGVRPENLVYCIYTSGSTGRPKGVQVEHRNVVSFFAGMDQRIAHDPAGTWLAVTSLSFDISGLELYWTLAHGFKVVLFLDRDKGAAEPRRVVRKDLAEKPITFGLFMWGNDDAPGRKKYELMLQGARFFDENGFDSAWTPERHFHAFGGPYPNPSVTGAAIAAVTRRLHIRAGSCVSPLHHPVRIAEEWAVVDNLCEGRVGLAFASGWQPNDFVLRPENYKTAKSVMFEQIETVRRLWRGEAIPFVNPQGEMVSTRTLPRPVQAELPVWITTAGNPETYREAGRRGANVLTHLLGQSIDEVAEKIKVYRQGRAEAGHDPARGIVTLMLHTFVGQDTDEVKALVRGPMKDYLRASVSLVKNFAWAFPAFKRPAGMAPDANDIDLGALTGEELDAILEFAFERYFETSGLFGTVEDCLRTVDRLKEIGVDDIACLLDFGVATEKVLEAMPLLAEVRRRSNEGALAEVDQDFSAAAQIRRHQVTHLQCTPSMARMLLMHDESRAALATVKHLMIGGEAFPVALARDLNEVVRGTVTNMYGPTETTIWSSTHPVRGAPDTIPIGKPIANTQLYVLDAHGQPVPPGVNGELFIGGDGVVRGYLHRLELTQERFLPDPFRGGGARMYRTGDVARWRKDGVVDFLGRADHQVKIRGYRIELGEIESQASRFNGVKEAICIVREDTPGDQRLCAYLTARGGSIDTAELKEHLKKELPEFMVPAHFIVLPALPQTPNGKVDRKALPPPEAAAGKSGAAFVKPTSEIETTVAAIWQTTLGKEEVGIDDNFFDIGGHSLLVVKMHRLIKEKLPQPVSLTDLYRFPTIRSFTEYLSSDGGSEALAESADRAARRRGLMQRRRDRRGRPS